MIDDVKIKLFGERFSLLQSEHCFSGDIALNQLLDLRLRSTSYGCTSLDLGHSLLNSKRLN